MKVALDTNVLAYFASVIVIPDDRAKVTEVVELIARLHQRVSLVVPVQALGELFHLVRRRSGSLEKARETVLPCAERFETVASTQERLLAAINLATDHKLQLWDALILTAAADAGCSLLLSEDMQDGFATGGLTVANPFASTPHPKLAALLA